MAWTNLPTNFINLVWSGLKKYRQYNNPDSTVSFEDVTEYVETEGTQMSAEQLNQMTGAVNQLMTGIASEFSTSTYYYIGDYCMYEGQLYRFTSNHSSGAWNSNHVTAVSKITNEMRADNNPVNNSSKLVRSGGVYTALEGKLGDAPSDNKEYVRKNGAWAESSGGSGGGTWGSITGTLSNQTDLQSALDAKANSSDVTTALSAKANNSILGDAFSTSAAYAIGDYCIYEGALYRFTSAHSAGAWNASHVTQVVAMNELAALSAQVASRRKFEVSGTASAGSSVTITDSRINDEHWQVPKNGIWFSDSSKVTTQVHWVTNITNHTLTLEATFTGATNVKVDLDWYQDIQSA